MQVFRDHIAGLQSRQYVELYCKGCLRGLRPVGQAIGMAESVLGGGGALAASNTSIVDDWRARVLVRETSDILICRPLPMVWKVKLRR